MATKGKSRAVRLLEKAAGGPLTLHGLLAAIREGEGWSQTDMAERLGISRANLCDIEKGRKSVAPARAAEFARALGYSEKQFVRLSLQEIVDDAGLRLHVDVTAA